MAFRDQDFLEFILDQLPGLRVTHRRMFGAIGLYAGEHFFAIIDEGRLYFVTDDATRPRYEASGMKPFQYAPGKFLRTYYEVPVDVLEDDGALREWARAAVDAQKRRGARSGRRPVPRTAGKEKGRATRTTGSRGPSKTGKPR
jgi:DNA transformation protein